VILVKVRPKFEAFVMTVIQQTHREIYSSFYVYAHARARVCVRVCVCACVLEGGGVVVTQDYFIRAMYKVLRGSCVNPSLKSRT
jgi:hypothetical protein